MGKKYLREDRALCRKCLVRKKSVINSLVSSKVRAEEAGGGNQVPKQRFPSRPWRDHGGADVQAAAHGDHHAGAGGNFLKELHSMESPCWDRFVLKEFHPVGGSQLEQENSMKRKKQKRHAVRD